VACGVRVSVRERDAYGVWAALGCSGESVRKRDAYKEGSGACGRLD